MVMVRGSRGRGTGAAESRTSSPSGVRSRVGAPISQRWSVGMSAAWIAGFATIVALQPAMPESAQPDTFSMVASFVMYGLLFASLAGLGLRRWWGMVTSVTGAVLLLGLVVMCPLVGHQPPGLWWGGQMAASGALVAASAVGLRRA